MSSYQTPPVIGNVLGFLIETLLSEGSLQMIWQGALDQQHLHSGPLINI
jgi:hypothetical protein